jgi:hypothetical protein
MMSKVTKMTIEVTNNLIDDLQKVCDASVEVDWFGNKEGESNDFVWETRDDSGNPINIFWVQHDDEKWGGG